MSDLTQSTIRLFDRIYEEAPLGIAYTDNHGDIIDCNQSFCRITGYTRSELKNLSFADITHPEDVKIEITHLEQLLAGKKNAYNIEKRYYHRDGKVVYVDLRTIGVRNEQGEIENFVGIIEDITERRETRDRARQAARVAARANRVKNRFMKHFSGEIQGPLGAVYTLSDLLERSGLEPEDKQLVQNYKKTALGLLNLTDKVIEFTQMTGGPGKSVQSFFDGVLSGHDTRSESAGMSEADAALPSYSVLFMDPDASLRYAAGEILCGLRQQVLTPDDLESAIELLRGKSTGDLYLADLVIADAESLEKEPDIMLEKLRAHLSDSARVFLTTAASEVRTERVQKLLCSPVHILRKPLSYDRLLSVLKINE